MKKIKIGFSFNLGNGGPSIFLKKLKKSIEKQKLAKTTYFIDPTATCNIFANKVRNLWRKPYFFRVDGIGIDKSKPQEHLEIINNQIKEGIIGSIGVIFQSTFSKNMVEQVFNIKVKNYKIIVNGTDRTIFNNYGENLREELNIEKNALVFISSAKWRGVKRLDDVINVFKEFKKRYKKKTYLIIIGKEGKNKDGIIYIPHIDNEELPKYLRTGDIYLYLSWIDNCPNSVIEAISCGLPVICSNQGGTNEIIKLTRGGIIVKADNELDFSNIYLDNPPKPNYKEIIEAMLKMSNNLEKYKKEIKFEEIDIDNVAKKYVNFIKQTLKKD